MTDTESFFDISKKTANQFLQNIVFVDDRAFIHEERSNNHEFDASEITNAFAVSEKICAVYKPVRLLDIEYLAQISKKADITVLDWHINIEEDIDDLEEEDEVLDPRGTHTKKIIKEILSDPITGHGSLKLIAIYTAETDLKGIAEEIYLDLIGTGIEGIEYDGFNVYSNNIKILVIAKAANEDPVNQFKYNPDLKDRIVKYSELPDFLLTEFTEMTKGLLTNFILSSLTALRQNTFRLIKIYNNNLDPAFLHHRLMLPNQEDSEEQLIQIFSNSIEGLLNYNNVGKAISGEKILKWLSQRTFLYELLVDGNNKSLDIDYDFVADWLSQGFIEACKKEWLEKNYGDLSDKKIRKFVNKERELHKQGSKIIQVAGEDESIDSEFSILTHHKSNLKQPSTIPKLSLGTVLKSKDSDTEDYYICIQAKCDSVRVEEERRFLFLPLEIIEPGKKFHFVIKNNDGYIRLKLLDNVYDLKTIKFGPNEDQNSILATEDSGTFVFESIYGEKFIWIAELKDAHSQRVANNFGTQLSRVGLDESEWLRRWSST